MAQAPMSFEECLKEAADNNPDLYIARESVNFRRTALWRGYTLFVPSLNVEAAYRRGNTRLDTGYESSSAYDADFNSDYTLFNGFRDCAALNQARADLNKAETQLQQARADLSYAVKNGFYELLRAQDAGRLAQKIFEIREKNVELVRVRYESGTEDKGALMLSEAEYEQAGQAIAEAARAVTNAQRKLNTVLGRPAMVPIAVTGAWDIIAPPAAPDFDDLARATPDYRQTDLDNYISREEVRKAWGAFYPSLSVNYNMDFLEDHATYIPLGNQWSVSAVLGLSLFDLRGADFLNLRDAKIKLRQAQARLRNQANTVAAGLQEAFINWQNAVINYQIQLKLFEAEKNRYEITKIKYQNGVTAFDEWNRIQNAFITAQNNVLLRQYQALLAQAAWEKALGFAALP